MRMMRDVPGQASTEHLHDLYEVQGLSTYKIGALFGCDPKTVYSWLVRAGIPRRPRGHNLAGSDNFMAQPGAITPFKGKTHSAATRKVLSEKASIPKPWLRGEGNGMAGAFGELNPNWKGGTSPERQRLYSLPEVKALIASVFARDEWTCQRCYERPGKLHAHHVRPWVECERGRLDAENLITLCRGCHHWVHSRENVHLDFLEGGDAEYGASPRRRAILAVVRRREGGLEFAA